MAWESRSCSVQCGLAYVQCVCLVLYRGLEHVHGKVDLATCMWIFINGCQNQIKRHPPAAGRRQNQAKKHLPVARGCQNHAQRYFPAAGERERERESERERERQREREREREGWGVCHYGRCCAWVCRGWDFDALVQILHWVQIRQWVWWNQ